jgi:nickel/cobalt transporter (NicO) family protein
MPFPMIDQPLTLIFAFSLGLAHSLEPSHAKVVLASYFLNHKRTVGEAILFALTVTIAHTLVIYTLAIAGFLLGPLMDEETIEGWGQLIGGILMIIIGLWMFMSEARAKFHKQDGCGHDHSHGHFFHHHDYNHDHPKPSSLKQIFILGFCSGAVPCLSGLAVLVQAWTTHSPVRGLFLVGVFSLGLGSVVLVMCLLMRKMASVMETYWSKSISWSRLLPIFSSAIILLMGIYVVVAQMFPEMMGAEAHTHAH